MKLKTYEEILKHIGEPSCFGKKACVEQLRSLHPNHSVDTFMSIYSQNMQRKIKKLFSIHHKPKNIISYYRNFIIREQTSKEGFLLEMAKEIDFPPSSLARIILEQHIKKILQVDNVSKDVISKFIKNPSSIQSKSLSREIQICIDNDENCGPVIEKLKQDIGIKYENILHEKLKENNIEYYPEEFLREEGYDKTPDFKLVVPISVENHVVNWIESKALFGDAQSHSIYLDKQFWSYTNRFGPGLVIYWFGFIDELNVNVEQGLLITDCFPVEFQTLPDLLDKHEREFELRF